MKYFDSRSAIKALYYLIAIDGEITPDELVKLDEVGNEIDPESYLQYRDEVFAECNSVIERYQGSPEFEEILQDLEQKNVQKLLHLQKEIWKKLLKFLQAKKVIKPMKRTIMLLQKKLRLTNPRKNI